MAGAGVVTVEFRVRGRPSNVRRGKHERNLVLRARANLGDVRWAPHPDLRGGPGPRRLSRLVELQPNLERIAAGAVAVDW